MQFTLRFTFNALNAINIMEYNINQYSMILNLPFTAENNLVPSRQLCSASLSSVYW